MVTRLRLIYQGRSVVPSISSKDGSLPVFESANLSHAYFPGRGVFCSVFIHTVVVCGIILLTLFRSIPDPPGVSERILYIDLRAPNVVMLLPRIEPAPKPIRLPARKSSAARSEASEPPSAGTGGLSYPGPQPVVSDVPEPTNRIQTVLQPDLEKPPILVPPLALPNIVQIADLAPAPPKAPEPPPEEPPAEVRQEEPPQAKAPEVQPEPPAPEPPMVLPALELSPPTRADAPRLVLPQSTPAVPAAKPVERFPKMELPGQMKAARPVEETVPAPEAKATEAAAKPAAQPKPEPAPKAAENSKPLPVPEPPSAPSGKKNLLSLSPMPASPKQPVKIPPGEARGRFAISPEPNLAASDKEPGVKSETHSDAIGLGKSKTGPPGNAVASANSPATPGPAGAGTAKAKASSVNGTGSGLAHGSPSGSPSGTGTKAGGTGTAQGSAKPAFAGITIVGGDYEPGDDEDSAPVTRARRPLQTSYGLNVISTEDSGGGLPFVGVFTHEQIYTVYLDMRDDESEQDPSWTLEFAVIRETDSQSGGSGASGKNLQGLILPFPAKKERPALPAEIVQKHLGKMILVYGIVSVEGKLEHISVKDSPDSLLNEPVVNALSKWVFRPAQLEGEPAAAKLLIGIPLWLPE